MFCYPWILSQDFSLLHPSSFPLQIFPEGQYKLEILFISQESEAGVPQAMIQLQIVTIESNNTVWELLRTYDLTD